MIEKLLDTYTHLQADTYFIQKDLLIGPGLKATFHFYKKPESYRGKSFFLNSERINNKALIPTVGTLLGYMNNHDRTGVRSDFIRHLYLSTNNNDVFDITVKIGDKVFNQKGKKVVLDKGFNPWLDFVDSLPDGNHTAEVLLKLEFSTKPDDVAKRQEEELKYGLSSEAWFAQHGRKFYYDGRKVDYPKFEYIDVAQFSPLHPGGVTNLTRSKKEATDLLEELQAVKSMYEKNEFVFGSDHNHDASKKKPVKKKDVKVPTRLLYQKTPVKDLNNVGFEAGEVAREKLFNQSVKFEVFAVKTKNGAFSNNKKISLRQKFDSVAQVVRFLFPEEMHPHGHKYFLHDSKVVIQCVVVVGGKEEIFLGTASSISRGSEKEKWLSFVSEIPEGEFTILIDLSLFNTLENQKEIEKDDLFWKRNSAREQIKFELEIHPHQETEVEQHAAPDTDVIVQKEVIQNLSYQKDGFSLEGEYDLTMDQAMTRGNKRVQAVRNTKTMLENGEIIKAGYESASKTHHENPLSKLLSKF